MLLRSRLPEQLLALVGGIGESPSLKYLKSYIRIRVSGNNCFGFYRRSANKSLLCFHISDDHVGEVGRLLDEQSISFVQKGDRFSFTVDKDFIKKHADLLRQIAEFVKETWKK